jgi:serine/threonine protein kinase
MTPIAAAPPQLNGYTFQRTLGSGGFADVHLYTQHRPQRPVAVKVLRAGLGDSALASFESEANLMAALSTHSSIVPIFVADVSPDGRPFLVMEYYSSPPLEKRIKAQPLSVSETLEYGIQLAGAVETAHRQGIIHRDIKPANVLISAGRKPVLTDFGISASAATGPVQGGMSVAWSAPEQINLQPTDGRADVYSLAATVYAMLSGHSPVIVPGQSNDQAAVMHRVFNVAPPRIARDDVPESLQRVLAVAMAKDPGQRYPSALEFARALQVIQAEMRFNLTQVELIDDTLYEDQVAVSDDGATQVRGPRSIDPDALALQSGPSAAHTTPPQTTPTLPPTPAATGFSGVGLPPLTLSDTVAGTRQHGVRIDPNAPYRPPPAPHQAQQSVQQAQPADQARQQPAPARRAPVAAIVVGAVVVLGLGATGIVAAGRGLGRSTAATPTDSVAAPVDAVPEAVPAPTDITGSPAADGVAFTWTNEQPMPGDSYLYGVVDPLAETSYEQTDQASASIPAQSGRTCIEVVLVRANGRSSEPARSCVETP